MTMQELVLLAFAVAVTISAFGLGHAFGMHSGYKRGHQTGYDAGYDAGRRHGFESGRKWRGP